TAEIRLRTAMKALDAREKTLQAIIETASAGILVRRLDGKITRVNKTFCELIGYTEAEMLQLDIVAITHADDAPIDEEFRKELISGKRSKVRRTKRYRHKNGAFIWVEMSVSLLRDATGTPEATVAIVQDMSETMRLRQEVQRRDEMYKTIVQNIPNATILLYDRDFRFISADGARTRGGATDPRTYIGKMIADVVPPENRARILAQYKATIEGESAVGEYLQQGRAYAVHTVPVRDETGAILAGMVFSYDTTEQHKQSNELRAATTRLSALIDHLSAGVLFEDESRSVQLVNNAFCTMFGIAEFSQIIGSNASLLPEVKTKLIDPEGFQQLINRRVTDGAEVDADRLALIDGRFLDRSYAPVEVPGVSSGHLWLYRDVTEREHQRAKLALQTEELEKLSTRDELTQLYNRRGFMMIAEQQLKSAARGKRRIILFFADMNGMKEINDTLGHKMGDAALVDCANILRKTFRDADLIARLGGDEFVALAVDAMPEHAKTIQERLKANFEALNEEPNRNYRITMSVGSSMFDPDETRPIEELVAEADALMYEQKRARPTSGRHSVAKKIS
ncbi:MAG: diguanylate cyclase, partial [Polyangiaceae bacterium]